MEARNHKTTNNERTVSPVIGVILMITITVILAGVIVAFVFGIEENIYQKTIIVESKTFSDTCGWEIISTNHESYFIEPETAHIWKELEIGHIYNIWLKDDYFINYRLFEKCYPMILQYTEITDIQTINGSVMQR